MNDRSVISNTPILLFLAIALCATLVVRAQTPKVTQQRADEKVDQWIRTECERNPVAKRLNSEADAYGRLLRLRAAHELGIAMPTHEVAKASPKQQQVEQADTGVAINVSHSKFTQQNETTIAIDRANPQIIIIGANDDNMYANGMPVYYSTNSGKLWTRQYFPAPPGPANLWSAMGDPLVASADDGTLYYAYLWGDVFSGGEIVDNIIVATSTDGRTWKNGVTVLPDGEITGFEDKETMCVDNSPTSPYYGRVYVAWVHYGSLDADETRICYSDDHCQSWSKPTVIVPGIEEFGDVKTGVNGEVLVTFSIATEDPDGNPVNYHILYVSTDGAQHFEMRPVHEFTDFPHNVNGYSALKGKLGPRCYPYTSFDLEYKTNTIHLVYGSLLNNAGAAQFYTASNDLGLTWSEPIALGYGATVASDALVLDRFCPAVTVNQKTGNVFMTCYSSERDSNNILISPFRYQLNPTTTEAALALEPNDFDPMLVDASSSNPAFIGDYIGADTYDSVYAAAWTEGVDYDGEVYAYVGLPSFAGPDRGVHPMLISAGRLRIAAAYPNPIVHGASLSVNVYSPLASEASIELVDLEGKSVAALWHGQLEEATSSQIECAIPASVATGSYFLHLRTADALDVTKIVVGSR